MSEFASEAQDLHHGIQETRQQLRDEHFPYEGSTSPYEALHAALGVMEEAVESFVKWAEYFPAQEPARDEGMARFRLISRIHHSITEVLG